MTDAFVDLLDEPRWLAWREEERNGKSTKVPYAAPGPGGGKANDPTTWGTHEQAGVRARRLDDGRKVGCGIVLGDLGRDLYLAGIDLDSWLDESGALAGWAEQVVDVIGSYSETSPSGRGLKAFFYIEAEDVRWFLDLISVEAGMWGTKRGIPGLSGADHGPGVELYCSHRYFTVTGLVWSTDQPRIVTLDRERLEAVAALMPPPGIASGAGIRPDRSRIAMAAALRLRAASFEAMCDGLRNHADADIRAWVREKGEAVGGRELRRIWDKISANDGTGPVALDDFWAYLPAHSYLFVPTRELWPAASVDGKLPPQPLHDDDGQPVVDSDGKKVVLSASRWLDRKRSVEQMTWAPGEELIIEGRLLDDGGWFERAGASCFNLYRPPNMILGHADQAGPWLDHVRLVYPENADHLLRWFAHRVQRPQEKINHAVLLGGDQGIGKDTLLEPVKRAVGPWNCHEIGPHHLGRFNGFVRAVILRISEARDLGEVDRFNLYEHLKTYCAAPPDVLRVNEKNLREYTVTNCCGVILTTNHESDSVGLPPDDRRFYVTWSPLRIADFQSGYFATCGIGTITAGPGTSLLIWLRSI
jgi:hypothetical protein